MEEEREEEKEEEKEEMTGKSPPSVYVPILECRLLTFSLWYSRFVNQDVG